MDNIRASLTIHAFVFLLLPCLVCAILWFKLLATLGGTFCNDILKKKALQVDFSMIHVSRQNGIINFNSDYIRGHEVGIRGGGLTLACEWLAVIAFAVNLDAHH